METLLNDVCGQKASNKEKKDYGGRLKSSEPKILLVNLRMRA